MLAVHQHSCKEIAIHDCLRSVVEIYVIPVEHSISSCRLCSFSNSLQITTETTTYII